MLSQSLRPIYNSMMGVVLLCVSCCAFADNANHYDNLIQHLQLQYLAEPTAQRAQYLGI